uniref:RING-type domain-containing protein n=1 Tax=Trypanosoma congolense (strain IL3000) TaxID=1068625 RepID=G0UNL6_TRYCI|nr:conserved hypothetical protein [Trypanosoma congolense IL3000]
MEMITDDGHISCLICTQRCDALAVFECGHFVCYLCGLHIQPLGNNQCPMCRYCGVLLITRELPKGFTVTDDKISVEDIRAMNAASVADEKLGCRIHGKELAKELRKLYQYVCPVPQCWSGGSQQPFDDLCSLKEHLKYDHGAQYCNICLDHRHVFLCEQKLYTTEGLRLHMQGECPHDSVGFTGHPPCRFCKFQRFYNGDKLLKHMNEEHLTCHICNRGEFRFTYYKGYDELFDHFEREHIMCGHPSCADVEPIMRVFATDFDLAVHKQRAHGIRFCLNHMNADQCDVDARQSVVPATSSGVNANHIIFDHVVRRETESLVPTHGKGGADRPQGNHKKGKSNSRAMADIVPHDGYGLPLHFRRGQVLVPMVVTSAIKKGDKETESTEEISKEATPHAARAFGFAESEEAFNKKNSIPSDSQLKRRMLDELIQREVKDQRLINDLHTYTVDFMDCKMLATTYYNFLRQHIFPKESSFRAVFPLLVATMAPCDKRDALVSLNKMLNSPEVQQIRRNNNEAKGLNQKERVHNPNAHSNAPQGHSKRSPWNIDKNNKNKESKGKQNAWLEKARMGASNQKNDQTTPTNSYGVSGTVAIAPAYAENVGGGSITTRSAFSLPEGSSWGGSRNQQQQQISTQETSGMPSGTVSSAFFADPNNFPELPSLRRPRASGTARLKQVKTKNAWNK